MGLFKEGGVPAAKKGGGWPLYTLVEKQQLSKDSMKLRFKIPVHTIALCAVLSTVACVLRRLFYFKPPPPVVMASY
jgi:hypothetical protein